VTPKVKIVIVIVAAVIVVGVAFAAWVYVRVPYVVAVGTPIRHDDFLFTVTAIQRGRLPDGVAQYRVAVRVQNQAKVVNYHWRDTIAHVRAFDSAGFGRDFLPLTNGSFLLRAGEERTAHLTFDVPSGYSSANLRFWDGTFMGDALNGGAYGKAIVPVEPYHPPFGT
jgi:hypothetical protein